MKKFKVKTDSIEEYNKSYREFTEMMNKWSSKPGRKYEIEEDIKNLKFKIIAENGED